MRLINMADRSEYGWAVVAEYEADELAVDSDDEKRIYRAEKEAEKKWLKKRKRQDDRWTARKEELELHNPVLPPTLVRHSGPVHVLDVVSGAT